MVSGEMYPPVRDTPAPEGYLSPWDLVPFRYAKVRRAMRNKEAVGLWRQRANIPTVYATSGRETVVANIKAHTRERYSDASSPASKTAEESPR